MLNITLPDGSQRQFPGPLTVADVAASIGSGLAKAALGGKVDGELVDTSYRIESDASLAIVTAKDADGLELIRHSTAHLLAYAVKELFPDAQVTIGPVIEHGFYYDFAYKRPFTPEDLAAIESKMLELAAKDEKIERRLLGRDDAVAHFKAQGEHYKAEIIAGIPSDEALSLYREGAFEDLCRGPHVPSTGKLKHFKLMKVAGAYWRGDHRNEMLQRIYGTAWASKEDLQAYLRRLEEAERRDHRRLGRELDLFHIDEHAPGLVFWHPKGWTLWQQVEQYMRGIYRQHGYHEVATRCCSASTAPLGPAKKTCKPTCAGSKRPSGATTGAWGANSTCFTSTNTRRGWCSGTPRAGLCGSRWSSTCAASTASTATTR